MVNKCHEWCKTVEKRERVRLKNIEICVYTTYTWKDIAISFERTLWGVTVCPAAMAACSLAIVIDARVCDIGRRGSFGSSGDKGRVHGEGCVWLESIALVGWMEEKVTRSRSSFYRKKKEHWQSLWWRPSSRMVLVVPLQPLIWQTPLKKKKSKKARPQNSKFDAIPFSEF